MSTEDRLLEIGKWMGKRESIPIMGVDEVVELVHEEMRVGSTYLLIKKRLSAEAKAVLSSYNVEIETQIFTAGSSSNVLTTLRWTFKHKQNGNESNKA